MRRRAFLDQTVISLSRHFVCVRLNAWQDRLNIERMVKLQGVHQNSSLALLAPDAPGVAPDGFPSTEACAWGPLEFNGGDRDAPWEEVGTTLEGLAPAMLRLIKQYPGLPGAETTRPLLPVFPDLVQVLNMAACDSVAVIAEVAEGADVDVLDKRLLSVIHEPGLVGRALLVRVTPAQWQAAFASGQLLGDGLSDGPGLALLEPDAYGQRGTLLGLLAGVPTVDAVRTMLADGLARFAETFRKSDRSTHIIEGRLGGVRWKEQKAAGWRALLGEQGPAGPDDCEGGDA